LDGLLVVFAIVMIVVVAVDVKKRHVKFLALFSAIYFMV
jgi:hypothetical protein